MQYIYNAIYLLEQNFLKKKEKKPEAGHSFANQIFYKKRDEGCIDWVITSSNEWYN